MHWRRSSVTNSNKGNASSERKRFLSMLGIAKKAGKLVCSTPMVCEAMRKKTKPHLVVVACDASAQTQKKLISKSDFYKVDLIVSDITKEELSRIVGKTSIIATVAVTDVGFAAELLKLSGKEVSEQLGNSD